LVRGWINVWGGVVKPAAAGAVVVVVVVALNNAIEVFFSIDYVAQGRSLMRIVVQPAAARAGQL